MALMFQRLAHNFVKNGYFPTDEETIFRSLNALLPAKAGTMRILDNCCGEGVALAEVKQYLGKDRTEAFGIEHNKERAWHAKTLLDRCIHGDINDCLVGAQQFGLVWLNPPYGDLVKDSDHLNREGGKQRLEKLFYRQTYGLLQYGGVMVLILPDYSYDKELSVWISRHFEQVRIFRSPEQRFKQTVLFGVRRRVKDTDTNIRDLLLQVGRKEIEIEELPEEWGDEPYVVPSVAHPEKEIKFHYVKLDPDQLGDEIVNRRGLWDRFDMLMTPHVRTFRRPLRQLSSWHLALALAAGQVCGVVKSRDGRTFVIKGDTHKDKITKVEHEIREDGTVSETRIATDRFVPVIKAIDFTESSQNYGQVLMIR